MTNEELLKEARDYALALHSSVHVRHTGAELIDKLCDALEAGTSEPVWEYGVRHSQGINTCRSLGSAKEMAEGFLGREHRMLPEVRGRVAVLRRRAAGPWEPVGGDSA